MTPPVPVAASARDAAVAALDRDAAQLERESRAANTWCSFEAGWKLVVRCCDAWGDVARPMSVPTAERIVTWMCLAHYSLSYIRLISHVIHLAHREKDWTDPTRDPHYRDCLRGIARRLGTRPRARKSALLPADLNALLEHASNTQERAVLVIGTLGGLRRSEVADLNVEHLTIDDQGLTILVERSKTDQFAVGQRVTIGRQPEGPCPVAIVEAWLDVLGVSTGPLFRHATKHRIGRGRMNAKTVNRIVKRYAARAGFDPRDFGAHSMRSGCATALVLARVPDTQILEHLRWRSVDSLVQYFRPRDPRFLNVSDVFAL